jgi:hypothetical protein
MSGRGESELVSLDLAHDDFRAQHLCIGSCTGSNADLAANGGGSDRCGFGRSMILFPPASYVVKYWMLYQKYERLKGSPLEKTSGPPEIADR